MKYNFPYICTLCYIINKEGQVLLQKKARGFGKGKWNGPGGKIEPGETAEQSAIREVKEETGIKMKSLVKQAELEFIFPHDESNNNYVHVFICKDYEGKAENKGEGELKWFKFNEIPYEKMWDDDRYWLPRLLAGEKIKMRFYFDKNDRVINYERL